MKKRHTIKRMILGAYFCASLLSPYSFVNAQETSADFSDGSMHLGPDTGACDGSMEGAIRYNGGSGATVVVLTSGTTWSVPADWNSSNNTIHTIGGGGGGGDGDPAEPASGGGGGAYSSITNVTLTPSTNVTYAIGSGGSNGDPAGNGGDTYFCNNTSNCASLGGTAVVVGAEGGGGGRKEPSLGGSGGDSASGVGTVKYSGGDGGDTTTGDGGAGGGGAAGPDGDGGNGGAGGADGGSGGGGANNGTNGSRLTNNSGGDGGDSGPGGAGGTGGTPGTSGTNGGGGGGGAAGPDGDGGNGGNGAEWTTVGSGGGGGGAGGFDNTSLAGNGGLYGGGGGGDGTFNAGGGGGGQGIIVIEYAGSSSSIHFCDGTNWVSLADGSTDAGTGANTLSASFSTGSVIVGGDNRACSGPLEGVLRYNGAVSSGMLAYWKFDETSGSTIADSAGSNTGTWDEPGADDVSDDTVTGQIATALDFKNTVSVTAGSAAAIDNIYVGGGMSVCAWVNPDNAGSWNPIINKDDSFSASGDQTWNFGLLFGDQPSFTNNTGATRVSDTVIPTDTWTHVCATTDGSATAANITLYIDGVEESIFELEFDGGPAIDDSGFDLKIGFGDNAPGISYYDGFLDELRLYERVLNVGEITTLYNYSGVGSLEYCNGTAWTDSDS